MVIGVNSLSPLMAARMIIISISSHQGGESDDLAKNVMQAGYRDDRVGVAVFQEGLVVAEGFQVSGAGDISHADGVSP